MSLRIVLSIPRRLAQRRRNRRDRRGRSRFRPWRILLAASVVAAVALTLGAVYLRAEVEGRFEGRLWSEPGRVYSDVLRLSPDEPAPVEALLQRLDRSGYAAVAEEPARPGQYRRRGTRVELYLREFESPLGSTTAGRVDVEIRGERVRFLEDARGAAVRRALIEPELLATVYGGRQEERFVVPLERVPPVLVDAVLAAEDARFFDHPGLDVRGILRASVANAKQGAVVQGGSTITQQTVKNLFLDARRTWTRKLHEAALALALDARYSKERILEVYLNEVYLGQRGPVAICGVEAASRFYFGHGVTRMTPGEAALLAGMIRSPGTYNPFRHRERSFARRDQVLDAMVRLGRLDPDRAEAARRAPIPLASGKGGYDLAPYAVDHARREAAGLFPDVAGAGATGFAIYTTIDTRIQENARAAAVRGLERLERDMPSVRKQKDERTLQAAVVVLRPEDGAVLALVGGRSYAASQFNRATQAKRQPGSCFKPFVYAAGFELAAARGEGGLTPATMLADEPFSLTRDGKTWTPNNYDRRFRGPVTVRRALEESLNVPAVRAAQLVGLPRIVETARAAGIASPLAAVESLPLGTEEVVPLELAAAYATLARQGVRQEPRIVQVVRAEDGTERRPPAPVRRQAIRPQAAFLVEDILRGVFERGTARSAAALGLRQDAAGKTGTTDDTRDAWFVGHNGETLALVWVGYDDNARTGLTGATGALPIWVDLMQTNGAPKRALQPHWPEGILVQAIDPYTGRAVSRWDPAAVDELFIEGTEPEPAESDGPGRLRRWWRRLRGAGADGVPGV